MRLRVSAGQLHNGEALPDFWRRAASLIAPLRRLAARTGEEPLAASRQVLVVGATGRIGRIVVRKLLLRGYSVRALVRGTSAEALEG